jgi:hypothetical protein
MNHTGADLSDLDESGSSVGRSMTDSTTNMNTEANGQLVRKKSLLMTPRKQKSTNSFLMTEDDGLTANPNSARIKRSQSAIRDVGSSSSSTKEPIGSHNSAAFELTTSAPGHLVGIVNGNPSQNIIISIIEDPIQCGYLRTFCDSEHSCENLLFIMEVIKLRELLLNNNDSRLIWTQSWPDLDDEYMIEEAVPADFSESCPWPTNLVDRTAVTDQIDVIWTKFLAKTASDRVEIPAEIIATTKKRLKMLNAYGPEVFGECIIEPLYQLQRDTLPRFLNSTTCTDMVIRIDSLRIQPSASSLRVNPPSDSLLLTKNTDYFENADKRFRLEEMLKDKILYGELLSYLRRNQQSENLVCFRIVEQFEDVFASMSTSKDLSKSWINCVTQAWNVFKYFVALGAPFEVGISGKARKEIMLSLAKPSKNMFLDLKKTAYTNLNNSFNEYKMTIEYPNLIHLMREEKNKALSSTRMTLSSLLSNIFG